MADKYRSLEELMKVEKEGVDYRICLYDRNHEVTVIAPHGGDIEPGTSEVAESIAGSDWNKFLFEGIKPSKNRSLHVTSTRFRHPALDLLLMKSRVAVSVHGKEGRGESVAAGGMNEEFMEVILEGLLVSGFDARSETNPTLSARESGNFVNVPRERGVQLEITRSLRAHLCRDQALMAAFTEAIRAGWAMWVGGSLKGKRYSPP